jgi:regulation of enolase protein 1 (concanavalin A-like superfamily)
VWHDSRKDCSHRLEKGLVVSAAIGRGLEGANLSAPRFLRPVAGDVAVQVVCEGAGHGRPAAGGLVIWKDQENYLRLDQGTIAHGHVAFGGCMRNKDVTVGRGRLGSDRVFLRLERSGTCVRALAGTGSGQWHSVGRVEFPADDPLQVGLFADGAIRPEVYLRLDRGGSEIRFTEFEFSRL